MNPPPGTATEKDVIAEQKRSRKLCELVDGILVEKAMDTGIVDRRLHSLSFHKFNEGRNLGLPLGGRDGSLIPGLVRIPDVAFALWRNIAGGRVPTDPVPDLSRTWSLKSSVKATPLLK